MNPGTQIVYVPNHAGGDLDHPDVEEGFVVSLGRSGDFAWCRYWRKGTNQLRTKANSEATPLRNIVAKKTRPQLLVDRALDSIRKTGTYDIPDYPPPKE